MHLRLAATAFTFALTPIGQAQKSNLNCSRPAVLHISMVGQDLYYQVNEGHPHKLYTLGETSDAIRDCSPERMLFVVAAPNVPVGAVHVEPKEQIERVRYFIQFANGSVEELGRDLFYAKLPITPDIVPERPYEDSPPNRQTSSPDENHFIMPGARERGVGPDEATAIAIAKAVLSSSAVRGNVRNQEPWHAELQGDRWRVSGRWHPDNLSFGGGGLEMFINKQSGEVSYMAYSK